MAKQDYFTLERQADEREKHFKMQDGKTEENEMRCLHRGSLYEAIRVDSIYPWTLFFWHTDFKMFDTVN